MYYVVRVRLEQATVVVDQAYEDFLPSVTTVFWQVYKKTKFTDEQINEIICEVNAGTFWQFAWIVERYIMESPPYYSNGNGCPIRYGDYIRGERQLKKHLEKSKIQN